MSHLPTTRKLTRTPPAWWPAVPLVLVQLASGMWYLPQLSFFAIYLKEQVGLPAGLIATVVAGGQVAGMAIALLGGAISGRLGSKWSLVLGLCLTVVASLVFQIRAPWLAAAFWCMSGAGLALQTLAGASYLTRLNARASLGILSAVYSLAITAGGALGNPLAGWLIGRSGFGAFGLAGTALTTLTALCAALWIARLDDRSAERPSPRAFWRGAAAVVGQPNVRMLLALRCLPTICYGMCLLLVPLLIDGLTGSKPLVAAYGTANLVVASAAQILAGRAGDRFGARGPTLVAFGCLALAALGLAASAGGLWGLFTFGVLAIAAAWALSALMYLWVSDGIARAEHGWAFGLLHAVWSLSMIAGSLLGGWLVRPLPGLPFLLAGLLNLGAIFLALTYYRRLVVSRVSVPERL